MVAPTRLLLALVLATAGFSSATAFGFSSAPVGGVQCRQNAFGASMCPAQGGRRPLGLALRMAREDGGAGKIPSKPGTGVGNKPGQGAGEGGAGEQERGGAGVAVLTKPPDVDKVCPSVPRFSNHCPHPPRSSVRACVLSVPALPAAGD